jgi:transcriptional antiterminator Rof (Rho-off)
VGENEAYRPIACGLHDQLEEAATVGRTVRVVFRSEGGALEEVEDRLVDVFARSGAEFVRTASGSTIRLDRLESVDGVSFRS